jgi:hypothetical protein
VAPDAGAAKVSAIEPAAASQTRTVPSNERPTMPAPPRANSTDVIQAATGSA